MEELLLDLKKIIDELKERGADPQVNPNMRMEDRRVANELAALVEHYTPDDDAYPANLMGTKAYPTNMAAPSPKPCCEVCAAVFDSDEELDEHMESCTKGVNNETE